MDVESFWAGKHVGVLGTGVNLLSSPNASLPSGFPEPSLAMIKHTASEKAVCASESHSNKLLNMKTRVRRISNFEPEA